MTDAARVREAFRATPRADFLSRRRRREADLDRPVDIGHRQTNSQPTTVATMLETLSVRPGDRVLDVGSGSGWTTALLAHLTGPHGTVIGVERIPDLVDFGAANLATAGVPWARITTARHGVLGLPECGPYDRILVSAAATEVPLDLVRQLRPGGVMVIPVAGRLLRVTRRDPGRGEPGPGSERDPAAPAPAGPGDEGPRDEAPEYDVVAQGHYRFVPLVRD